MRLIVGRIRFTPHEGFYEFEVRTRFDRIMAGIAYAPALPEFVDPADRRGVESLLAEEGTIDAERERLLAKAQVGRPWTVSNLGPFRVTPGRRSRRA